MYRRNDNYRVRNSVVLPNKVKNKTELHKKDEFVNLDLVNDIKDMFSLYDRDDDGKISNFKIKSLLISLGRNPTDEEVSNIIKEVDPYDHGIIQLDNFIEYMESKYKLDDDILESVLESFKEFDADYDGYLSKDEFKIILKKFESEFDNEQIEEIISKINFGKDDKFKCSDFVNLWKYT